MKELILSLVLTYLPYTVDTNTPEFKQYISDLKIIELEPEKIELIVCGAVDACNGNHTFAYDHKMNIIHVPSTCNLEELRCKAALMHEFVHVIQNYTGKYTENASCQDDLQLEVEAYTLQNHYLNTVGINFGFIINRYSEYFLAHCLLQEAIKT
jgi:hypothetical protein